MKLKSFPPPCGENASLQPDTSPVLLSFLTCSPHVSADFHVPSEYLTNIHIRDKVRSRPTCRPDHHFHHDVALFSLQLAAIKLSRYGEDLLFYLYYMNGGDLLQLLAAVEL